MEGIFHNLVAHLGYELSPLQKEAICILMKKQDVLAVLPTGSGKSTIFASIPYIHDKQNPQNSPHVALIVSPLRALMRDQAKRWSNSGFTTAGCILPPSEMQAESKKAIMEGRVALVFASPEALLAGDQPWRQLLRTTYFRKHLCLLAFDEAHCITQWGDDFRETFSCVGELRSMVGNVPTLAMTATLPETMRGKVLETLHLDPEMVKIVAQSPDRPNIFLKYVPRNKGGDLQEPDWLLNYIDELRTQGAQAKKAILYCRYINTVSQMWGYIMGALGDSAWVNNEKVPHNLIVDMYHSSLDINSQERVVDSFTSDGVLRCVIATIAFGMGIEIRDVRYVFHWGLSKSAVDYWQEVGRCGRDGEPGTALLYPAKTRGYVTTNMDFKEMVSKFDSGDSPCMRQAILSSLWLEDMGLQAVRAEHNCKDRCIAECICTKCMCCSLCQRRCPCHNRITKSS